MALSAAVTARTEKLRFSVKFLTKGFGSFRVAPPHEPNGLPKRQGVFDANVPIRYVGIRILVRVLVSSCFH
jgi:hypothetical protein